MNFLTLDHVLKLHQNLIDQFGGLTGIRDLNLLLSALEMPKASMFGEDLHPSLHDKAAAYVFHIIQNHPFNDGNKRTGFACGFIFLYMNGIHGIKNVKKFEDLCVEVAKGNLQKKDISLFLKNNSLT